MSLKLFASVSALAATALLPACSENDTSGVDSIVGGHFTTNYSDDAKKQVLISDAFKNMDCPKTQLMVLIGSSERIGRAKDWHVAGVTADQLNTNVGANAQAFADEIDTAERELIADFEVKSKCPTLESLVFLRVIDADGPDNSRISTTVFRNDTGWKAASNQSWIFDGQLTVGSGSFEINLPASVSQIVQTVATHSALELEKADGTLARGQAIAFERITYYIKAHGGRVSQDRTLMPDGHVLRDIKTEDLATHKYESALMFDTNGPEGRIGSSLFVPHWGLKEEANSAATNTAGFPDKPWTSGYPDNAFSSGYPDNDMSSGKSLMFNSRVTAVNDANVAERAEGLLEMGAAATYQDIGATGTYKLSLPLGTDSAKPQLLILDSCYGTPAASAAFPADKQFAMLFNPNPIYFAFLEYKAMDLSDYMVLPAFLYSLASSGPKSESDKTFLDRMTSGQSATDKDDDASNGLSSDELGKSAYKELHIWSR